MNTTGKIEPIGNLQHSEQILNDLKQQFDNRTLPTIKCIKDICMCGFCAPKADNINDYKELFDRQLDKEKYYGN